MDIRNTAGGASAARPPAARGRASLSRRSGRFERFTREPVDDGDPGGTPEPLRTEVTIERAKRIITRNRSPDVPFDFSINPYKGCEHGCIYCFARPTHAFMGLSPGLDFESRLFAKPDAARLLERELAARNYRPRAIAMGTNTDPYQPIEKKYCITRSILEVLSRYDHPASIVTKSALILRDLDILAPMAERRLVKVFVSVTTLDRSLARNMEPRATTPGKRIATIRSLADAGVPVGVLFAPVIPALNDHELEAVLEAARGAGAEEAGYIMLRLPLEIKDLFSEWLEANYPNRKERVFRHIREMRGGRENDPRFGHRMRGHGPYADLVNRRFALAVRRLSLNRRETALRSDLFHPPAGEDGQMNMFGNFGAGQPA